MRKSMKVTHRILQVLPALVLSATLYGQGRGPSAFDIDITGYWSPTVHEDGLERGNGPEIADYGGFALNEAGRLFALSYDPSRLTLRYHQCDGYVVPYQMRAVGNFRTWEERDPHTQRLVAFHWWAQTTEGNRTIWMDGRPHPPAWAPHTFMGFSTGHFVGNQLVIYTTHLKQGWLRRNGSPQSDQATVMEFVVRYGDHLSDTTIVTDPVYLTEPEVRSNDYVRQPGDHHAWLYACDDGEEITGRAPDVVPNYLFGKQPFAKEYSEKYKIPLIATFEGAESMYPGFAAKAEKATQAQALAMLSPLPNKTPETSRAIDPDPHDGEIHVLHIRDNAYMLVGDGANITVQTGDEGAFLVDSGTGQLSDKIVAAIRRLTQHPIQYIFDTSAHADHVGGNAKIAAAGADLSLPGSFFDLQSPGAATGLLSDPAHHATLMAQNNVVVHLEAAKASEDMIPADTFLEERRRKFQNGELVEMFYEPDAITDADSIVHFRRSDVISTGDIFNTTQYPFIDLKNGGSVQGEIKALNDILSRTGYAHDENGGTAIVPGHGYLCNEHEVTDYRDMVVIVRDRVEAMMKAGSTLDQIKAARVTADYDTRYGANSGPWTTAMFIEAVYDSLKNPPARFSGEKTAAK
jgi:glyoxylase-like metal-dependent hydrolase (beta-lactamase superfamily II)